MTEDTESSDGGMLWTDNNNFMYDIQEYIEDIPGENDEKKNK